MAMTIADAAPGITAGVASGRVLVVEDDASIGQLCRHVLKRVAGEVVVVATAEEAAAELRTSTWDLLLTDIWLPGMNGLELTELTRDEYPSLPVLVMTAQGGGDIAQQAEQAGAKAFVRKPFAPAALRALVSDLLERSGPA